MSAKLKNAIELMASEGLTAKQAAPRAGMKLQSLQKALRRKHVIASVNQLSAEIRSGAAQRAFHRIDHAGATAKSEAVKLEANKWVAGVGNIAPVKRIEGRMSHSVTFGGFDYGETEPEPIDVTPGDD